MFSVQQLLSRLTFRTSAPSTHEQALTTNDPDLNRDPDLRKRRIAWIDEMIMMVPEFVRTHQKGTQPIHFFFIYSSKDQTVLYQADSCACGICFEDGYGILGRFEEKDWANFQELVTERLDYYNETEESALAELYHRVVILCPMHAIRSICIAWMLDQPSNSTASNFRFDF